MFAPVPSNDDILAIAEAQSMSDKVGPMIWYTVVSWDDYKPEYLTPPMDLGGTLLAIPPTLPNGYKMKHHKSWEYFEIETHKKMLELCQGGDLKTIYEFDTLFHEYTKELRTKYHINIFSWYEGHIPEIGQINLPDKLYNYSECVTANKMLAQMTGKDLYRQLMSLQAHEGSTTCWINENAIVGIKNDGGLCLLKDSDVPLSEFVTVQIQIMSERDFNDPIFEWE